MVIIKSCPLFLLTTQTTRTYMCTIAWFFSCFYRGGNENNIFNISNIRRNTVMKDPTTFIFFLCGLLVSNSANVITQKHQKTLSPANQNILNKLGTFNVQCLNWMVSFQVRSIQLLKKTSLGEMCHNLYLCLCLYLVLCTCTCACTCACAWNVIKGNGVAVLFVMLCW